MKPQFSERQPIGNTIVQDGQDGVVICDSTTLNALARSAILHGRVPVGESAGPDICYLAALDLAGRFSACRDEGRCTGVSGRLPKGFAAGSRIFDYEED